MNKLKESLMIYELYLFVLACLQEEEWLEMSQGSNCNHGEHNLF